METLLLTPGPLTTSARTRAALGRDWGSRDAAFIAMSEAARRRLAVLAGVADSHVTVPIPGSGTGSVEAAVQTLVPRDGRLLVLVNGAYGRRIADIARRLGRAVTVLEAPEHEAIAPDAVARALDADPAITDVALVHCETTSGVLNPFPAIAAIVRATGRRLLLDAMSSFAAVPIDGGRDRFTALVASANKGIEGVPGLGYVIAERAHLGTCAGNASSLTLDLHAQWQGFERDGQYRFTPPVQVIAALSAALDQLDAEGGIAARHARYAANLTALLDGMQALGFQPLLDRAIQAPVIVTFRLPDPRFDFACFHAFLQSRGIVIYPGKLTAEPSFRIGCIGAVSPDDMRRAVAAVAEYGTRPV